MNYGLCADVTYLSEVAAPVTDIDTVRTTAILADDNALVRTGLRAVLTDAGITVLAEAATGPDLLREALRHRPDVLVLGTVSPDILRDMSQALPDTAILLVNAAEEARAVRRALRAGVCGYLPASADGDDIARAVSVVAAGWVIFSRGALSALTGESADCRPFPELTTREFEVLDLVAAGLRNSVIARRLHLAPKTVSNHISNIFVKLGVCDRATAIVRAREAGLGADPG